MQNTVLPETGSKIYTYMQSTFSIYKIYLFLEVWNSTASSLQLFDYNLSLGELLLLYHWNSDCIIIVKLLIELTYIL